MTTLTQELAPSFWDKLSKQGFIPEDIAANRIKDLGTRLCDFMIHHSQNEANIEPANDVVA